MKTFLLEIYYGTLIDKHYASLKSIGDPLCNGYSKRIPIKSMWSIFPWLRDRFPEEEIDKEDPLYISGSRVLIVSISLNEELFFSNNGKLAKTLNNGTISALIDEFVENHAG
jgi:hypothetical protein